MLETWQQYMEGAGAKVKVDLAWIVIGSYIIRI